VEQPTTFHARNHIGGACNGAQQRPGGHHAFDGGLIGAFYINHAEVPSN